MGARSACFFLLVLMSSGGCALLAGVGDYEIVDDPPAAADPDSSASADSANPSDDVVVPPPPVIDSGSEEQPPLPPSPLCNTSDSTLVLCFRFEGNTNDEGASPPLAVIGTGMFLPGAVGQGARFDGVSTALLTGTAPKLNAMKHYTIEAFVRLDALPPASTASRFGVVDSDNRFGLFIGASGFTCTNSQASAVNTTVPLPLNTTVHLACTRDGTSLVAYQDGVQVGLAAAPGTISPAIQPVAIGMNAPNGEVLHGLVDELRVFDHARTAAEIAASSARRQR